MCNICFSRRKRAPNLNTRVAAAGFRSRFLNGRMVRGNAMTLNIRGRNGITGPSCRMSNVSNNAVASGNMSTVVGSYLDVCGSFLAGGWRRNG